MIKQSRTRAVLTLAVAMAILVLTTSTASAGEAELLSAISALKDHIDGTTTLTAGQINAHKLTIDANSSIFGDNDTIIAACFDLVETYDTEIGPLFVLGSPIQSFDRNSATNDIHWAVYWVMQYIMDGTYTDNNVLTYPTLLDGFKFGSSAHFPGPAAPPADPEVTHTATINASFPDTYGRDTMHWADRPARKPTGTYLAPGTIVTITVPSSMVGEGYQVRIGCHSWDMSDRSSVRRLDRSSLVYDIDSTQVKVASPLGGGIYIEVPYLVDAGVIDIQIKNAVRSPYYSYNTVTGHITSLSEWQTTERNHPGPWADFQSEKFLMNVPTDWIYNLADPVTLMADWDKATDATNDLMGFPHDRGKESHYPQVDIIMRVGFYAPGYPSVNATYNPDIDYHGTSGHHLLTGPQNAWYYEFHEQGHGYLFTKFPGEVESNVNLLHVAVWDQKFGYSIDEAFRNSMDTGHLEYRTLDTAAVCWMMCENFKNNDPMEQLEKQYQLKGHAKFVEIARLFGWDVLGDYWYSFNYDYENSNPIATDIDNLLLRLSRAVGFDIRPLFHFWGTPPIDPAALADAIAAEDLRPSLEIYDTLVKYKSFIPADQTAFQTFAFNWWEKQPSSSGYMTEAYHALLWDTYDEAYAALINTNAQNIIDLYFPYGPPTPCDYTCGDLNGVGVNVDLVDYGLFADCWGENPSTNSDCICANLVEFDDKIINLFDLYVLAELFLTSSSDDSPNCSTSIIDPYPPGPDPMSFAKAPTAAGSDTITMTAARAIDISGVEYYFACTAGGGHDSGWQESQIYEDTSLLPDTSYTYTVKARDISDNYNETAASAGASATTDLYDNIVLPARGGVLEFFTSEYGGSWVASALTNGVTNEDGWASTANPTQDQEFIYSFRDGKNATLVEAVIHGGTAEGIYYSENVEVWASTDGITYTEVASGTLDDSPNDSILLDLEDTLAQNVKLKITSGYRSDYWELAEFVVYGVVMD